MYNLEELKHKTPEELVQIAAELGVTNIAKKERQEIELDIIDAQAISAASEQQAPRKRSRISVKNVDRVYSANQMKAKKIDKNMKIAMDDSLYGDLTAEERDMLTPVESASATEGIETPAEEATPKKKTRKKSDAEVKTEEEKPAKKTKKSTKSSNSEEEETAEVKNTAEEQKAAEEAAPAKRTRKTKAEKEAETKVEKAEEASAENETKGNEINKEESVIADSPSKADDFVVPEAAYSAEKESMKEIILKKTDDKIENTDDSDFIILEDIPVEMEYSNPMDFFEKKEYQNERNDYDPQYKGRETAYAEPKPAVVQKEKPYEFDDIIKVSGVLETVENYGFLRSSDYNYLPSPDDVYISQQQIKHHGLKTGDVIDCFVRPPKDGEKFFQMGNIERINGREPADVRDRIGFEFLTPLFPDEKFKLCKGHGDSLSSRVVDLFSPIGKGQRALIVAQPKTGKTMLMKDIANSIAANHPEAYLMMLLIDERPEEVTDMARTVNAEVIASTFDAPAENHVKIAGIVLEKAKRMVECGHDVVIFLDSITRLARAYNTVSPASGKVLSGGVDANALHKPKRFFGAARNIENGGSLTIIATALIDTGSKMDEVIFEEFKGTGNMELQLDRSLANKRVFPAVNLMASSTRRDDLLQDPTTLNRMWVMRNHLSDMTSIEAMDFTKKQLEKTTSNEEFLISMNG